MHVVIDFIMQANPLVIYTIVALTLFLESSGIPVANNTLLLLTGALTSFGHLSLWLLISVAILGSISGACSAYVIGTHGGRPAFLRLAAFFHISTQKIDLTERWFHKAGIWMIFFSRMTPYVRPFTCFFGGITTMPFKRFFGAALAGSIIWCIVMVNIGAALGPHWKLAILLMRDYTIPTLGALLLLIALYCFTRVMLRRYLSRTARLEPTLEEAPGEEPQRKLVEI
ncbi:MAG: DedA family protein [Ktedonobacteraceae bacterium]